MRYLVGNLLESQAEALVNTVNTVGVMGKGIALQFKNRFPENFKVYAEACKKQNLQIGKLLVFEESTLLRDRKIIINFPTKTDWRLPSQYEYIEAGLVDLLRIIKEKNIKSIAIPALGSGNGGLDWGKVKPIIEKYLGGVNDCEITIYEPSIIQEEASLERVKLTPARAMLLSVLYDLVREGEFVSEFSSEKIAYFLQRFGAKEAFNLEFKPRFYGPYSGKVKHVLHYLNGSYIIGYAAKDKKPFEELGLIGEGEKIVTDFLARPEYKAYQEITNKTKAFLKGFYSNFALELLSSIDFIVSENKADSLEFISQELDNWNDRKKTLFKNPHFIQIALNNLQQHLPL